MKTQTDKTQESQNLITPRVTSEPSDGGTAQLMDNRTSTIDQRKLRSGIDSSESAKTPIQKKSSSERLVLSGVEGSRRNNTGLPDTLKSGIENLSGYSMDDVKVHYNSSKPSQLQAHAYAQGTDIHLATGQEKHLPHEAWHVVQQKQGRVKPTRQLKSKVNINDDVGLEKEADVMGNKALRTVSFGVQRQTVGEYKTDPNVAQLQKKSKNAKVGIEIETTLPVRKNNEVSNKNIILKKVIQIITTKNYPVEDRELIRGVIKFKDENELWNLINIYNTENRLDDQQKDRLKYFATKASKSLRERFDPGYKTIVYNGNGWEAMVDHVLRTRNAAGSGQLLTDSAVEIVTEPVSTKNRAKIIMRDIQTWLHTVMIAIKSSNANSYIEGDYIYEIPEDLEKELLSENQLLGNMQINVGMNLKDVQTIFKDYANQWSSSSSDLNGAQDNYIQEDKLWNLFIEAFKVNNVVDRVEEEDKPYLRSILFQYMYLALRQEKFMKRETTQKNNYPILPKTTIKTQIAISSWSKKNLWNTNWIYRNHIAKALDDALCEYKIFDKMFDFRKNIYNGILNNQEPGEIKDTFYIEEPSNLETEKDTYAGVFEIRHGQNEEHLQSEWLGIWNKYLD